VPSKPVVKSGQKVKTGQLVAEIPEGKLSAALHAPIAGKVISVTDQEIIIARE
jgi:Na+-translocating ferredoxin:NAD+ oxidoreductase RnfC subunit